mmetsp:Transcript_37262/g.105189  ORF Transcript_37262/g.105189 Transcript_37262/m.105189 type:complete len:377 (-) Transcript_37262:40-1170(-)
MSCGLHRVNPAVRVLPAVVGAAAARPPLLQLRGQLQGGDPARVGGGGLLEAVGLLPEPQVGQVRLLALPLDVHVPHGHLLPQALVVGVLLAALPPKPLDHLLEALELCVVADDLAVLLRSGLLRVVPDPRRVRPGLLQLVEEPLQLFLDVAPAQLLRQPQLLAEVLDLLRERGVLGEQGRVDVLHALRDPLRARGGLRVALNHLHGRGELPQVVPDPRDVRLDRVHPGAHAFGVLPRGCGLLRGVASLGVDARYAVAVLPQALLDAGPQLPQRGLHRPLRGLELLRRLGLRQVRRRDRAPELLHGLRLVPGLLGDLHAELLHRLDEAVRQRLHALLHLLHAGLDAPHRLSVRLALDALPAPTGTHAHSKGADQQER